MINNSLILAKHLSANHFLIIQDQIISDILLLDYGFKNEKIYTMELESQKKIKPRFSIILGLVNFQNQAWGLSHRYSIMFNLGLYF